MTIKSFYIICIFLTGCGRHHNAHRSPLRKTTYSLPTLVVSESNSTESYARTSSSYKKYPIFTVFDYNFFIHHLIPIQGIKYVSSDTTITQDIFNKILEDLTDAIVHHKTITSECTVIRDANFNYQTGCGLLILKCSQYPFVIKFFRETAESFVNPYGKGLEPITFFFMSGGSNRHITGLTRIPNREYILCSTQKNPVWQNMIRIPRKWYWTPQTTDWLIINGYNIDGIECITTRIPSTYAIIEDYIAEEESHFLSVTAKKRLIMELSIFSALHLDPHIKNFIITQDNPHAKPLITIVDTEDPQCMTGITDQTPCSSYFEWYAMLTGKFIKNFLFNIKTDIR